jgi:hypothetical protein
LLGKTTAEMQTSATFIDAGWDFVAEIENGTEDIWKMSPAGYPVLSYQEIVVMPEVSGLTQEQAIEVLEAATFDVSVEKNYHPDIPLGYVYSQHPIAGNQIAQYSPVKILISLGPSPFAEGDGSTTNPYRIATAEELFVLAQAPETYHLSFILTDNIDLSAPEYHLENALIAPDVLDDKYKCFEGTAFTGVFEGRGHIITGLTIMNTETENGGYLGLFGQIEPGGVVRNLGVEQAHISMEDSGVVSGIIAGDNFGKITQCYATGELNGGYSVGGLVGQNNSDGQIYACYAEAEITAWYVIGGLIGENYERGNVSYCYASGHAATTNPYGAARGFLGRDSYGQGIVDSCYYLETIGSDNGHGIPLSDSQMKQQNSYVGWDFVDEIANGTEDIWYIDDGNDYPQLWWELVPDSPSLQSEPGTTLGSNNTISWDAVTEANDYYAECAEDVNFTSIVEDSGWITDVNCTFEGLELEQTYWYRVKARNDSGIESDWSNVESSMQAGLDEAVETVLDVNSLKNENMAGALGNKIDAALEMIDEGFYTEALEKLENDILKKTDGCAKKGQPDKNDWIDSCEEQGQVYPFIMETIEYVIGLIE